MSQIKTERLVLRKWEVTDAQVLAKIVMQPHVQRWLPDWQNFDKRAERWISLVRRHYALCNPMENEQFISWAITFDSRIIGQIGIGPKLDGLEIGYFIGEDHQSRGFATEAVKAVVKYAFDVFGFSRVIATVQPENLASNAVVKKAGFSFAEVVDIKDSGQTEFLPFNYYEILNPNEKPVIIGVRENPDFIDRAADYFNAKWKIDRKLYHESMTDCIATEKPYPRWYLMLRDGRTVGCCGIIENDFMVSDEFSPWMCGLYVEKEERGKSLGGRLLNHARMEAFSLGLKKLYLNTDHIGYYEKYGWRYIGDHDHKSGEKARVYEADAIQRLEGMADFFDIRADIYDSHMLDDLNLAEFYEAIAKCFVNHLPQKLLDLGCGTGLELEHLFEMSPELSVTGVDLSSNMLKKLEEKYSDKQITLIHGSYFDADFGKNYDSALSTYSFHHFSEEEKLALYRKIFDALKPGGIFVHGDYTVKTLSRQQELITANDHLRTANGISEGEFYHFDIPFTAETEIKLLKAAGFAHAETVKEWDSTSIFVARK